jgi:hypothetical protein
MAQGDVHAKNNQQRSADLAHVGSDLENAAKSLPLKDEKITHKLECDQGLRTVTSRRTGNKCGERTQRWDALPTWQFNGVEMFKSTRLRIMAIRRAVRASE